MADGEPKTKKLKPFILANVQCTGTSIGFGRSTEVEEVTIPVVAASKKHLTGNSEASDKALTQLAEECQLMSTLRHPNIVQFLGVYFPERSRLPTQPVLVMERMLTSLHNLLSPEKKTSPPTPLSLFDMNLKCSVLDDVARGLAFLHEKSIFHRNMSATNVLLNSDMVAKISDLRQARIVSSLKPSAPMTISPGNDDYMPPEAKKGKYDASIDIFSFGVIAMFTIGKEYPYPEPATYFEDEKNDTVARTEIERRREYMGNIKKELGGEHPLIWLIQQCLHNGRYKRPSIGEVLCLLEEARAGVRDDNSERNKCDLVRALQRTQSQSMNQNLEGVIQDLVTKNAGLVAENADLKRDLQQKEEELEKMKVKLTTDMKIQQLGTSQPDSQSHEGEHFSRKRQKETGQATSSESIDILERKPITRYIEMIEGSDGNIYRPIEDISTAWQAIARQLKVDDSKIQNEEKKKQDATASANEMIRIWLGSDRKASWSKLIKAMKVKQDLVNAAKKLKTALQSMKESDDEDQKT